MFRVREATHILSRWLPTIPLGLGLTWPRGRSPGRFVLPVRYSILLPCTRCLVIPGDAVMVFVCDHRSNTQDPVSGRFPVGLDQPLDVSPLHAQMAFSLARSRGATAMWVALAAR